MNKIKKQPQKALRINRIIFFLLAVFLSVFFSCGIDEYYFLPQLSEGDITLLSNTEAEIIIQPIDLYYAISYSIFYRIYISEYPAPGRISQAEHRNISQSLATDYNAFVSVTDPTTTTLPSANTFSNRNYFELEFEGHSINNILTKEKKKTLKINFPTTTIMEDNPVIILKLNDDDESETQIPLCRSGRLISPLPKDYPYFRNTPELCDYTSSTDTNINADVSGRQNLTEHHAYVSMYIVAIGVNNYFSPIYSKPTHIGIFKLPNM